MVGKNTFTGFLWGVLRTPKVILENVSLGQGTRIAKDLHLFTCMKIVLVSCLTGVGWWDFSIHPVLSVSYWITQKTIATTESTPCRDPHEFRQFTAPACSQASRGALSFVGFLLGAWRHNLSRAAATTTQSLDFTQVPPAKTKTSSNDGHPSPNISKAVVACCGLHRGDRDFCDACRGL